MKYLQALQAMADGAVCTRFHVGHRYRYFIRDGNLYGTDPDGTEFHCALTGRYWDDEWRIVTPAPSEAKPEPHADDCKSDAFGYVRNAPHPKPDPSEDVSLRMRTAKLENDVCEIRANLKHQVAELEAKLAALANDVSKHGNAQSGRIHDTQKRVEHAERDIFDLSTDARCRIKECAEHDSASPPSKPSSPRRRTRRPI